MTDWHLFVVWATGVGLCAFMAAIWLEGEDSMQAAVAGLFWPVLVLGAAVLLAQAAAVAPFVLIYFAGKRFRKWAMTPIIEDTGIPER